MVLVVACSDTLEHLETSCQTAGALDVASSSDSNSPEPPSTEQLQSGHIDLSKATKLKDVFRCESLESGWITRTLETVTPKHPGFQQISIHIPIALGYLPAGMCAAFERYFDEASPGMHWWDLDRLLVWLWEFQSIRVKVMCPQLHGMNGGRQMRDWARYLFPELTRGNASIIGAFSTIE